MVAGSSVARTLALQSDVADHYSSPTVLFRISTVGLRKEGTYAAGKATGTKGRMLIDSNGTKGRIGPPSSTGIVHLACLAVGNLVCGTVRKDCGDGVTRQDFRKRFAFACSSPDMFALPAATG